ncbi:MAG TPA: hypothetical protein ENJ18_11475 [Nannocystis exedens]|nr:hypothetical protein [Nannocystis exedens]
MHSTTLPSGLHHLGFVCRLSLAALAITACGALDPAGANGFEGALSDATGSDSDSDSAGDSETNADDGQFCEDPCSDEGASRCQGASLQICGDDIGDGCLHWGEPQSCESGQSCTEGACVAGGSTHFGPRFDWPVPAGGTATGGLLSVSGSPEAVGDDFWSLVDINGDEHLDLVVTARAVSKKGTSWFPRTMGYPNAPYWEVFLGQGDGFADSALPWPVPSDGLQEHGFITATGTPKIAGDPYWMLLDIDGDRLPELVLTGRAKTDKDDWIGRTMGYPNTPYWEVYRNEGDGFAATSTPWVLPQGGPEGRGYFLAQGDPLQVGDPQWEVRDLNSDGLPDLLVTGKALSQNEDGLLVRALGSPQNPYWEIHYGSTEGSGGGFTADPKAWMVPIGGFKNGGFSRSEAMPEAIGDDCWRLRDLNGDGLDDLIITARASDIDGVDWVGRAPGFPDMPHWVVFPNEGQGFSRTGTQWPLPVGGLVDQGFTDLSGRAETPGGQSWETFDLDGDGHLELVVTSTWEKDQPPVCEGQVLGFTNDEPHWNVFETTERGFTTTPWPFAVPADAGPELCGLHRTRGQPLNPGDSTWFTANLDADGYPDLVMTNNAVNEKMVKEVFGHGENPHWRVSLGL